MTLNGPALEAWFRSIKGQIDLLNSTVDCLTERVVCLERQLAEQVQAVRIPVTTLRGMNSRLEGGDVA